MSDHPRTASVSARTRAIKGPLALPTRTGVLVLGLLLSSVTPIAPAFAATITVGNAGDPAAGNAAKCNVASTCTLRDAIAKAAAVTGTASGDAIVFSMPANSTINLSGDELLVNKNLILDGSAVPGLAISGNNVSRVLKIDGGYDDGTNALIAVTVTLKQLVIKNGMATGNGHIAFSGGGILNRGTLALDDCAVANNTADVGGGIANSGGTLTLTGSTVTNNTATLTFSDGGGIENIGTLVLNRSTVSGNAAAAGGGIYNVRGSTLTLTGSTVSGNTADGRGGGIVNNGSLMMTGSTVSDNVVSSGNGGGIANQSFSILTMANSTVSGNLATNGKGGGIANNLGELTLTDSMVTNNMAGHGGGGVYNDGVSTLIGNTVSGNGAEFGGGVFNDYHSPLTLTNSTVADNTARNGRGGGIYNQGPLTLVNSTLAGNSTAGDIYNRNVSSVAASASNAIIESCTIEGNNTKAITDNGGNLDGGNGCGLTNASSMANAALNLDALADNDGPTLTMMPRVDSAAIGHGLPSVCDAAPVSGKDQRGVTRSTNACTSGAVDPYGLINLNQHALSGSWADPTTDGQGILMDIGPDFHGAGTGLLFAGWYTYDVTAAGGQRWYTLQGQVSGSAPASIGIYSTTGGRFHSTQATSTNEIGRATLAFSDCSHGTLTYAFTDGSGRSGRIPLTRLLSNATCSPIGSSGAPALFSGAWADLGLSGQGMVFDISAADKVVFVGWYTYSPTGAADSDATGQRWYTLQGTFESDPGASNSVGIYESTGGVFNSPANVQTIHVGTANLVFISCTSATLEYTFTAGTNNGMVGTLDLTRVGAVPGDCHM